MMKLKLHFLSALSLLLASPAFADDLLPTLLTTRGKLLVSEDFSKPLAPFTGQPVGFATGFSGWRRNGGEWFVTNGTYKAIELAENHHPATASYGLDFKDAIIQCDVRLDDVPANGRRYRALFLKATDAKDYVCALTVGQGGLSAAAYNDNDINPATKQREHFPSLHASLPVKLGEWHTVVLELKGEEAVCTLDGKSVTFSNPLIGADKHSIQISVGTEGSFRNFRVWEALPNLDWPKHKQALEAANLPVGK